MDIHGLGVDRETGLQRARRTSLRTALLVSYRANFLTKPLLCKPLADTITRLFLAIQLHTNAKDIPKNTRSFVSLCGQFSPANARVEGVPANLDRTAKLLRLLSPCGYTLLVCLLAPDVVLRATLSPSTFASIYKYAQQLNPSHE